MSSIVDVSVNARGHVSLPFYDRVPDAKARGSERWTGETLIAAMDAAGVDKAFVNASVAANGVGGRVDRIEAQEVAEIINYDRSRLFAWVGIDPLDTKRALSDIQTAVTEFGFKGVHCYPHWFGVRVDDRQYYPIYAKCSELNIPIAMQVGSQTFRARAKLCAKPEWLDQVAFDFPELKIFGLHVGSPWVDEMIMLCRNYENVYIIADAHAPSTWEPSLIEYMSGRGRHNFDGMEKVLWGTDWPMQTFSESLDEARALGLSETALGNLLGGNAERALGV